MNSERRINASRANGARSKGPKTPEGKARSSMNAVRHGMLAKTSVLQNESPDAFRKLLDAFFERFAPCDEVERGLVEEMAVCHWRIRRGWAVETELWNGGIDRQPPASDADGEIARMAGAFSDPTVAPSLSLLNRYETRLHRMFQRAYKTLLELRACPPPPPEAVESALVALPTPLEMQICRTNLTPQSDTSTNAPEPVLLIPKPNPLSPEPAPPQEEAA